MGKIDAKKTKEVQKILDGWGFKYYVRHCQQPSKDHYGELLAVVEEWNNESMADFIVRDILPEIAPTTKSKEK